MDEWFTLWQALILAGIVVMVFGSKIVGLIFGRTCESCGRRRAMGKTGARREVKHELPPSVDPVRKEGFLGWWARRQRRPIIQVEEESVCKYCAHRVWARKDSGAAA